MIGHTMLEMRTTRRTPAAFAASIWAFCPIQSTYRQHHSSITDCTGRYEPTGLVGSLDSIGLAYSKPNASYAGAKLGWMASLLNRCQLMDVTRHGRAAVCTPRLL